MKLYDISQEVFHCEVFPGDPAPRRTALRSMSEGSLYNLTAFSMCAHNGTHVDAPSHFCRDGKNIDQVGLDRFVGPAYVAEHVGPVLAEDALTILEKARKQGCGDRILIKGRATVTKEAALVFAREGILLFGNESQTVGPENAPMEVHLIMLGAQVVLLEGIRLGDVPEGRYLLCAAPLNLGGAEGSPCRAVLMET